MHTTEHTPKRPYPGRPPGQPGVTKDINYTCSSCQRPTDRKDLVVKRITFLEMGKGGRQIKSRTVGWICGDCLEQDPAWNMEPFQESPGIRELKRDA